MSRTSYRANRKAISMDNEITKLRDVFNQVEDKRASNACHKLPDILMSAYAMFSLKCPSLLNFEQQTVVEKANLTRVYGIEKTCSDVQLRSVLDPINPQFLRNLFPKKFETLRQTGLLKEFQYKIGFSDYLILSCDGVEHFSSKKISCPCCCKKTYQNGTSSYHHSMLCAALVHPNKREVFLMEVEPIVQQDGVEKNDCERNAAKRLQENLKKNYEMYQKQYNFLIVEDALYANAPHVEMLESNGLNYLLNVKPDSHQTLFACLKNNPRKERYQTTRKEGKYEFEYLNNAPLCASSPHIRVNFLKVTITDKKGVKTTFSWITNLKITENRLFQLMTAARARWKIENETFNTLKNLGYHFEHNYGHGKDHLSTMFAYLMLWAFYVDQLVQACCHKFQQIEQKIITKLKLWQTFKAVFQTQVVHSILDVYQNIAALFCIQLE
jgi:hypothetical protein